MKKTPATAARDRYFTIVSKALGQPGGDAFVHLLAMYEAQLREAQDNIRKIAMNCELLRIAITGDVPSFQSGEKKDETPGKNTT
jgi:hypothetical protein